MRLCSSSHTGMPRDPAEKLIFDLLAAVANLYSTERDLYSPTTAAKNLLALKSNYRGRYQVGSDSDWFSEVEISCKFTPLELEVFHILTNLYAPCCAHPPPKPSRARHTPLSRKWPSNIFPWVPWPRGLPETGGCRGQHYTAQADTGSPLGRPRREGALVKRDRAMLQERATEEHDVEAKDNLQWR